MKRVNFINNTKEATSSIIGDYECFRIENPYEENCNRRDEPVMVYVGGIPIDILIDSGADCNFINSRDWDILVKNNGVILEI